MRTAQLVAALVVCFSCTFLVASCTQSTATALETDETGGDRSVFDTEAAGEAGQGAYESVFHFVEIVPDDGKDVAGGWQKATAVLKFADWRTSFPIFWRCPIAVGMPIRAALQGRISPRHAAQITAEIATE